MSAWAQPSGKCVGGVHSTRHYRFLSTSALGSIRVLVRKVWNSTRRSREKYLTKSQMQADKQSLDSTIWPDPPEIRTPAIRTQNTSILHFHSLWHQGKNNMMATTESCYFDDQLATTLGHNKNLWLPWSVVFHKGWNFRATSWMHRLYTAVNMRKGRERK